MEPGVAPWKSREHITVQRQADGSVVKTYTDGEQTLNVTTSVEGTSTLVAKDKDGTELFNGPINTKAEQAKVPAEVAKRLDFMTGGIQLRRAVGDGTHIIGGPPPGDGSVKVETTDGTSLTASKLTLGRSDGAHVMTLNVEGAGESLSKTLTVKDAQTGKVIFDGPVNTPEQRKALPADVAQKLEGLEAKAGK
jgi:hypothetical protein